MRRTDPLMKRCQKCLSKIQTDAMLRQGSSIHTLHEFVAKEIFMALKRSREETKRAKYNGPMDPNANGDSDPVTRASRQFYREGGNGE